MHCNVHRLKAATVTIAICGGSRCKPIRDVQYAVRCHNSNTNNTYRTTVCKRSVLLSESPNPPPARASEGRLVLLRKLLFALHHNCAAPTTVNSCRLCLALLKAP